VMKWLGGGHGSGLAEAGSTGTAVEHQSSAVTGAVTGAVAGAATSKLNTMAHRGGKAPKAGGPNGSAPDAPAVSPPELAARRQAVEQLAGQVERDGQATETQVADALAGEDGRDDKGNAPG
jgi:hypothetical protein